MPRSATVTIPLTKGYVAIVDLRDYKMISQYKWCVDERPNGLRYANTTIRRRTVRMHEIIFPNAKPERDHRNGDGLDNRRSNLRPATRAQNAHNYRKTRKPTSSRYKGVTFQPRLTRRPWQSRLGETHLGYFETEEEAGAAYDAAAKRERGEYARTNNLDVAISPNHRYKVISRQFKPNPTPGHPEGRILEYTLACGHTHQIKAFQAPKIGTESRCKACAGGL